MLGKGKRDIKKACFGSLSDKLGVVFIWFVALVINIKHIFFSFDADEAYTAVMGYRMLQGDRLFLDMWEPHQTSAVVPFLLEKVFVSVTGSVDGVILWLNFCGTLFFLAVAILLIVLLKPYVSCCLLHYMAAFFMVMRPKNVNMPSYANLFIVFTTLFWLLMVKYALEKRRTYLFWAVPVAFLAAMAYPSGVLMIVPATVIILVFSSEKLKDILWSAGEYILLIVLFLAGLCLFYKIGLSELIKSIANVFVADSHYDTAYKGWPYFTSFVYCVGLILILFLISLAVYYVSKKKADILKLTAFLLMVVTPLITVLIYLKFRYNPLVWEWIYYYLAVLIFAIVAGIVCFFVKKPEPQLRVIYLCGMFIGLFVVVECMLLTNLSLISIIAYTSLPVICSFITISNTCKKTESSFFVKKQTFALLCILGAVAFQQLFLASDQAGNVRTILNIETFIKNGPEKGTGSTYSYSERVLEGYKEWEENVSSSDSVLLGNTRPFMLTAYMYGDFKIANYSAISTPSYDKERLEAYWSLYPERRPTVIVIASFSGQHDALSDNLAMIIQDYECCYKGTYWNFYRKQQ